LEGGYSLKSILECAVERKAQYIISGDKRYLLPLKEYQGIKILSPVNGLAYGFLKICLISAFIRG